MTRAELSRLVLGALLFVAGAAIGWLSRGIVDPSAFEGEGAAALPDSAGIAGGQGTPSPDTADAAPDASTRVSARGEADPIPPGSGEVAVIGEGDDAPTAADSASEATGEGPTADGAAELGDDAPRGQLDPSSIRDVVREHRSELGFCFAWQLHQHPELAGRLTMEFVIGAGGRVTRSSVFDDALGDETVAECFASVTRRMEFPPPEGDGEVTVRYPFVLSADDPGPSDAGVAGR